jgi:type II secretory pathway pseudopilin PulG
MDPQTQSDMKVKGSPGDVFLQLGIIVTLYVSSFSLASLLFQIINKAFPDALNPYFTYNNQGVLWSTASLIIMFPIYILLGWFYKRQLGANPEKGQLAIRKWLVYLTLFLTGLALAIDLITLVYYFLNGEISIRFILKVLVVLYVAGLIFGYYLYDVRATVPIDQKKKILKLFSVIAIASVVIAIVLSFVVIGTPVSQRKTQFDQRRVNDLQNIQSQVIYYWQSKQKLPNSLADVQDPFSNTNIPADPETGKAYTFTPTGPMSFKLCATFDLPTQKDTQNISYPTPYSVDSNYQNNNWQHGSGETCFTRTIDPQFYPPRNTVPVK